MNSSQPVDFSAASLSELIRACKLRPPSSAALDEFERRFSYLVYGTARAFLAGKLSSRIEGLLEDLTQEAWYRILVNIKRLDPDRDGIKSYLQAIVRSACADYLFANRKHLTMSQQQSAAAYLSEVPGDPWNGVQKLTPSMKERVEKAFPDRWFQDAIVKLLEGTPEAEVLASINSNKPSPRVSERQLRAAKQRMQELLLQEHGIDPSLRDLLFRRKPWEARVMWLIVNNKTDQEIMPSLPAVLNEDSKTQELRRLRLAATECLKNYPK